MTDPVLMMHKLATLEEHCARARRRRPESLEGLRANVDLQDALAMSLFVAIQEAIDIAFHVVADEGWGVPGSHAEGFTTLADRGVIDRGSPGSWRGSSACATASPTGMRRSISIGCGPSFPPASTRSGDTRAPWLPFSLDRGNERSHVE